MKDKKGSDPISASGNDSFTLEKKAKPSSGDCWLDELLQPIILLPLQRFQ
jgi:hypothetical protein